MSMFSFPTELNMSEMMKPMTSMAEWTRTEDMHVSPLMVYPLGATAAATAVGFGLAGQMAGLMMGAVQGAMQSQAALLGAHPDLSWMFPTSTTDLPPEAGESGADADAQVVTRTKSAELVALKPAPDRVADKAPAKVKAKAEPAKSAKPKTADTKTKSEKAATPVKSATTGVVEKLKSDAEVAAAVAGQHVSVSTPESAAPELALEPEDFRRPAEMQKPEMPDDLKLISGVGPKLEQVLNGLGVWTFAQIAGWKPEEVAWVDDYLQFSGRIGRDNWISQAGALAKGGATAE